MEVAQHVVRDAPDVARDPVEVAVALPASILRYDSRRARATSIVLQTRLGRPADASGTTPSLRVHLVAAGSVSRDRPSVVFREPPSDQGRSESETYRTRRAEWTRRTAECLAIRRALPPGGVTRRVVSVRASLLCRFPHLGPEFVALRHHPVAFRAAPAGEHLAAPRPHPGSSIAERVLDQPGGTWPSRRRGDSIRCVSRAVRPWIVARIKGRRAFRITCRRRPSQLRSRQAPDCGARSMSGSQAKSIRLHRECARGPQPSHARKLAGDGRPGCAGPGER